MPAAELPVTYHATSTGYCLRGTMADGTYTRAGSVASNRHPLGTKLTVGGVRYVVRDRIGYGTELDLWMPSCAAAIAYGRRTVRVTVGWWEPVGRVVRRRARLPRRMRTF